MLMCRMAGYVGPAIRLGEIVSAPAHSLVVQSYKPREMQTAVVNADGYGAALWLDDGRPDPALYRTVAPIWADPNQQWMNERLLIRSAIAAVRSATPGIGFELANVQPFTSGKLGFAHNGFITDFQHGARRLIGSRLKTGAFEAIQGTSDSEHIFGLVLQEGLEGAVASLESLCRELDRTAVATMILGDGEKLSAIRWAHGLKPATLYAASWGEGVCMASEPLDGTSRWRELPTGEVVTLSPGDLR